MGQHRLHPSSRLSEAEWLAARRAPFGSHSVASVVPGGFPAYLRILHPAQGRNRERLRWAEVASKSDRTMHRLVQFHAINRTPVSGSEAATPPESGNLPSALLTVACAVLAEHTATPEHCWFCLWNGYGWLHPTTSSPLVWKPAGAFEGPDAPLHNTPDATPQSLVLPAIVHNGPCVEFPQREYLLFEGPLEAAAEIGWNMRGGHFIPQSPNLFWPDDHAWCVASEIDLFCTLVAGSDALAESLLADPRLEAWRVFPDDSVTADSDDKNT